jgi:uncharacterized coiled-coil DUF342 family protein
MPDGTSPLARADLEASEGRGVEAIQRLLAGTEARFSRETTEIRAEVAGLRAEGAGLRTGLEAISQKLNATSSELREEYLSLAQRLERAETTLLNGFRDYARRADVRYVAQA